MIDLDRFKGHTERPWHHDQAFSDGGAPEIGALSRRIARVLYHNGSNDPEVDANARLIAAAPDLLAECRRLQAENDHLRKALMDAAEVASKEALDIAGGGVAQAVFHAVRDVARAALAEGVCDD